MKLIDKYLSKSFFVPLLYCLMAFIIMFIAYRLMHELEKFIEQGIPTNMIVLYYVYTAPVIFTLTAPFATLLALLYCLGQLSHTNEIIAMRASGIALFRIVQPYIIIGFLLAIVTFTLAELFVPPAKRLSRQVVTATSLQQALAAQSDSELYVFNNSPDSRQWDARGKIVESNMLTGVTITQYSHARNMQRKYTLEAERAEYVEDFGWIFYNAVVRRFSHGKTPYPAQKFQKYTVDYYTEKPSDITPVNEIEMLNILQIVRSKQHVNKDSNYYKQLRMEFMRRLSAPMACFVFVLLAAPFGISHTRAGMIKGVISSILLCLSYYSIAAFLATLGKEGTLSPIIAAWMPIVVFTCLGFYLLHRMR